MSVKIYTKNGACPRCDFVLKRLKAMGIDFEEHKATEQDIEGFRSKGYGSFPVVESVIDGTKRVFTGVDIKGLNDLKQAASI